MSDRPWLEDGDPSLRVERALLKRLNAQQPPVGSADHGWAALAADIAGLQTLGTGANLVEQAHAAAHAAKGGAGFVTAMKVAAGVVVAGGALWGGSALLQSDGNARPPQAVPAPAETPSVALRSAPQAVLPPQAEPEEPKAVLPPTPGARTPASETTLAEEGRLLAKAHQLVQGGQPQAALEILRQSAARYPRSVLFQEREVLTIEALGATGATAAAKQRAQLFLKRYPSSPHAGKLKRFIQ